MKQKTQSVVNLPLKVQQGGEEFTLYTFSFYGADGKNYSSYIYARNFADAESLCENMKNSAQLNGQIQLSEDVDLTHFILEDQPYVH